VLDPVGSLSAGIQAASPNAVMINSRTTRIGFPPSLPAASDLSPADGANPTCLRLKSADFQGLNLGGVSYSIRALLLSLGFPPKAVELGAVTHGGP
jgi:hypothetical protein